MMDRTAVTVSQLTNYLKGVLESDQNLRQVLVSGEISNLTIHGSGHIYFSLKDENSLIKSVMFRSNVSKLTFRPEEGMKVLVRGSVSIYERSGSYQLYVTEIRQDGLGDLFAAYEQLKKQLASAGVFSVDHKKKIPLFPGKIGIITSPTGAAVQDMIDIIGRRYALAEIEIYPAVVQGEQAPESLIAGIEYFDAHSADVIIIGRGGGSIEDLWAFNNPDLALAVYNCNTPVISAVGHETDYTICDFAADLRAPTPSGAAELAVPNTPDLLAQIRSDQDRCVVAIRTFLQNKIKDLEQKRKTSVLKDAKGFTNIPFMELDHLTDLLKKRIQSDCEKSRSALDNRVGRLDALSPLKVLQRGYSVAQDMKSAVICSVRDMIPGETICLRLYDGEASCLVKEIKNGKETEI